ncbi:MAG: CotH kinase family protein, partial [Bacteroidaceae bacterium]|nr:CotH kinase family protein [Bacteroidaceae bacterium]
AMTFAESQLEAPVVDKSARVFSGSLVVNVQKPEGATLRYTTDGTTPTMTNGTTSTTGRISVTSSTTLRFRLFKEGYLPSEVVTRSFIQDNSGKPIIAIATDSDNLYSTDYGIFVKGPNGRPGNGQNDYCNWNMDWDRPANFEYITESNECVMSQEVDMEVSGGWSRGSWPKAFKVKSAKYYNGKNSLDYQFFDEKPFLKHKVLQIRHGGSGNMLNDAALQETVRRSGLNANTQSVKPVRVYINGAYYGDFNMREPNNKHFAYANYGIDTDLMDHFEMSPDSGYVQKEGTKDAWNTLIAKSYNAANSDTYKEIGQLLDIDGYINYMAIELFLGNWDWPQNNVKAFRDIDNGKFNFVIFDLDGSFGGADLNTFKNKKNYTFDPLRGEDPFGRWTWNDRMKGEIEFVTLFENMVKNADFRRRFADALCVIGGSVFTPDNVYEVANSLYQQVKDGDPSWLRNNCNGRQATVAQWLTGGAYDFGVSTQQKFNASLSSNLNGSDIYVNDMAVPMGKFSGTLYRPVTVKAVAPAGYRFLGWKDTEGGSYTTKTVFSKQSVWSYYNQTGGLDGVNWKNAAYAKNWPTGKSPIGYDKAENPKGLNTWFSTEKLPTYYVCKTFNIDKVSANDCFVLDYVVDDAMVVYINGQEAGRYNLPSGTISYNTYSTTYAHDNPDSGEMTLPTNLFKAGENIISVEVHNNDAVSTDIHWEASLKQLVAKEGGEKQYVSTDPEYAIPEKANVNLVAIYEQIPEKECAETGMFPVRINEVSADNSMYVDDYIKKDDWIELYNTTDKAVDVAGMYLSDNPSKPNKYQIPDDDNLMTVIEPRGHLVIWASKRDIKGSQIHVSFKLGNDDNQVLLLTSADGEWCDTLKYNEHRGDETVGRYPDGGNDVYKMQKPTIGKTNVLTSYAKYEYTSEYTPKPDPAAINNYQSDSVVVGMPEYYTVNGVLAGGSRNGLANGVYIMKYRRSDGSVKSKKIIINK